MIRRLQTWLAAKRLDRITAENRARIASPDFKRRSNASRKGWDSRRLKQSREGV